MKDKGVIILSTTEARLLSKALKNLPYTEEDIKIAKDCAVGYHFITLIANLTAPANISKEVLADFNDLLEEV